jgi:Predicted AAA-ATPase
MKGRVACLASGSLRSRLFSTYRGLPPEFFNNERAGSFFQVRTEKQFFRDNTEFIAKLEDEPEFVALFRPPRFGKSFFAMMLANYYCVKTRGVEWERRFGGTSIFTSPTKEQGTYLVLPLVSFALFFPPFFSTSPYCITKKGFLSRC